MTDLAVPDQNHSPAVAAPAASPFAVKPSLAQWAQDADIAFQLATQLSTTSFIPSTMRGKVGDITACLLAGNELGLPPMAALKSMDVIHGTPGLRAHAMRGLVQSKGHDVEVIASTDVMCQMRGRRKGSEEWQTSTWTIGRAQLAGYVAKNAMYKTQPANMLAARATGEVCRWIASDVLHGVPYNSEELRDSEPQVTATRVGAPATAAEILARRGGAEAVPQIEAPAAADVEAGDDDQPVDGEPVDEAALLWEEILAAGEAKGWSAEETEREFLKGSNDVPVVMAQLATLQAFHAHLTGGAA